MGGALFFLLLGGFHSLSLFFPIAFLEKYSIIVTIQGIGMRGDTQPEKVTGIKTEFNNKREGAES